MGDKISEIAEQAHLFLLYKSMLPVSSDAKPFQNSSTRDAVHRDFTLSKLSWVVNSVSL